MGFFQFGIVYFKLRLKICNNKNCNYFYTNRIYKVSLNISDFRKWSKKIICSNVTKQIQVIEYIKIICP